MRDNSKRNFISKRPTALLRMRSVIFSLINTEEIIRSLSCKNPFCAIVKGLRFSKASEEQIPTAILEETTKRVNCHENGNLPLFCIKKDTRGGVLYAPFACVLMVHPEGLEPSIIVPKTIVISTSLWVQIMIFAFKLYHKFCIVCKFSLLYIWTDKTKFSKKHFICCFFLL